LKKEKIRKGICTAAGEETRIRAPVNPREIASLNWFQEKKPKRSTNRQHKVNIREKTLGTQKTQCRGGGEKHRSLLYHTKVPDPLKDKGEAPRLSSRTNKGGDRRTPKRERNPSRSRKQSLYVEMGAGWIGLGRCRSCPVFERVSRRKKRASYSDQIDNISGHWGLLCGKMGGRGRRREEGVSESGRLRGGGLRQP